MSPSDRDSGLRPGAAGSASLLVAEEHTAARLGSGKAPVLGTPAMIALMEAAAVASVEDGLAPGQETLGVLIEVEHIAATPVGLRVTATAELIEREGRRLVFKVEAHDGIESIGRGRHVRVVVDAQRFRDKTLSKLTL